MPGGNTDHSDCAWQQPKALEICDMIAGRELLRVGHVHVICPLCGRDLSIPCSMRGFGMRAEPATPRHFRRKRDKK